MNTDFKPSFEKDLKKILDKTLKNEIKRAVLSVENAGTIRDIPGLKKLIGYKRGNFYRIKIGDYRIGITIENDIATFYVVLPRKDIYKYFP
jgi:mRNA interferase RelE/StbE